MKERKKGNRSIGELMRIRTEKKRKEIYGRDKKG
jgi:hypothetical protein